MTTPATLDAVPEPSLPWAGLHHLALATRDLDATIRFYCGLLEMRALFARRTPDGTRHLFIDLGGGATLHFWEFATAEIYTQPPLLGVFVPGALQHLALRLPDEAALRALQIRLRAADVAVTDIFEQAGLVRLCFFEDNNGIALEASCWLTDLTALPIDHADPDLFTDPATMSVLTEIEVNAK